MKILHYLTNVDLRSGGVVRAVLDLCDCLSELDLNITLAYCCADEALNERASFHPFQVDSRPNFLGRFSRNALAKLDALVRSSDVVHLHAPWDPANLHLARLCRKHRVPYVVSPHGMLDDWSMNVRYLKKVTYLHLVAREFISGAQLVHCTAEEEARQAGKRLFGAPTAVIPLALDLKPYGDLPGTALAEELLANTPAEGFRVLFLSRVHPKKGVEYAIEALALLRSSGILVSLIIAGPGEQRYMKKLKGLAHKRSVDDCCHFVGSVHGAVKLSFLQLGHVLVLPTAQENFGLVLPEALAAGLPVITTRNVAIWRELERSQGARIVDRTAHAFAAAIRCLQSDPDRRATMGQLGRDWATRQFSGVEIAQRYEAMYRQAIQRASSDDGIRPAG